MTMRQVKQVATALKMLLIDALAGDAVPTMARL
jgi:hypothetical protein